jgi:hypothetical protein
LAGSGITFGCAPGRFCPTAEVTRGQMAAFLSRALHLSVGASGAFFDDDGNPFEADIERLAAAGITKGCALGKYCPATPVTRAEMATLLARALELPLPTSATNEGRARALFGPGAALCGPGYNAINQVAIWSSSRPADAQLIQRIADQPHSTWLGEWSGDVRQATSSVANAAALTGAVPVFVLYNIPFRDYSQYSAGGLSNADAYRTWIDGVVAGIGDNKAVVIVEPDAIALIGCLTTAQMEERYP